MGRSIAIIAVFAVFAVWGVASAAEIVWLDGRRETVKRVVVKDNKVLVSFDKGLRRVSRRKIVSAVGDDGNEISIDRALVDKPPSAMVKAALAQLPDAAPENLPRVQEQIADSMSRVVVAQLVVLTQSKQATVRARAATTLLLMGTDETISAGLTVALADADKQVRRQLASALFRVMGALRADDVVSGLEDRDTTTRATFSLVLGRLGDKRAIPTLKTAGLKNRDHHFRESAAETLAELGDDSGVSILIKMLSRTKHPAGASLPARIFLDEKVRVCNHLGRLRAKKALPALKKASKSKNAELANAAAKAIAEIGRAN